MRWVKTAIITVIVLAIIPTIIMTINKLSGGPTKYMEYEITLNMDNINETVYELYDLIKLDENNDVTNLLYVEINGEIINVKRFYYDETDNILIVSYLENNTTYNIIFNLDNPSIGSNVYKIVLYDEIFDEPSVSSTVLTLISLIPLILVSGLLVYQYKELKLKNKK